MRIKPAFGLLPIVLSCLICSCMRLGPDYLPAQPPADMPSAYQHALSGEHQLPAPADDWWHAFQDPELNRLVEAVLANNLDIRKAVAAVLEVRAQFRETRADRWPTLGVEAGASKTRQTTTSSLTGTTATATTDSFSLFLPATFELDLWGRLARAEDALRAQLLAAEENRLAVAQTVVAETVTLYLKKVALEREIEVTRRSIGAYQNSRDLVTRRYNKGLTSILDVRQARRTLAQTEAGLPLLVQELGLTQQNLELLAGRYPFSRPEKKPPENYYVQYPQVPAGLPSDLLGRRPDIRTAEARLKALHAQVGIAYTSRFPRITLTGQWGYLSDDLSDLFDSQNELWNMAAGLVQPLFDFGKRKAAQKAAEARFIQGQVEYARTVLSAFADVESALLTRQQLLQRRKGVLQFLSEARATQNSAQLRYERGLVDYLTVLEAQQVRLKAELELIQVEKAIYQNRVALHRALGGGWG
ncbi:MAG: efflux transporter outer membrane subunit [Desulfobacteraceae bacterium]